MAIADLLTDFDEMGFAPTTLCENPDEYAREWKEQLVAEIERLKAENGRFESNMKSVLEIEKENVRKETAIDFYSEMYDFAYRTKSYYTDVLNDIIAKIDETFNDFRVELESLLRECGVEVEE